MSHINKGKIKLILGFGSKLLLIFLTFYTTAATAQVTPVSTDTISPPTFDSISNTRRTSLPPRSDTIVVPQSDTFSFRTSAKGLDAPINYHADDSMVVDIPGKKMYLYGKTSNVKYSDNDLSAPLIV